MKLLTVALVAAVCGATLACSGGSDPSVAWLNQSAPLTAPWTQMKLPLAGADVLLCSDETCSLTFPDGDMAEVTLEFVRAIESDGWTQLAYDRGPRRVRVRFTKNGERLVLCAVQVLGVVTVTIDQPDEIG